MKLTLKSKSVGFTEKMLIFPKNRNRVLALFSFHSVAIMEFLSHTFLANIS